MPEETGLTLLVQDFARALVGDDVVSFNRKRLRSGKDSLLSL